MDTIRPRSGQARPASAVVLARQDQGAEVELLFLKRPSTMRAFAGFHAFPGGTLHAEDVSDALIERSVLAGNQAEAEMGDDAADIPAIGFYLCALREMFEELGLLFVKQRGGPPDPEELDHWRGRLLKDEATFTAMLTHFDLDAATDSLVYLERWLAPAMLPVRFDVRMFTARFEGTVVPAPDEVEKVEWLSPSAILALAESGAVLLAPPTIATIDSLAGYETVEHLMTKNKTARDQRPIEIVAEGVRRLVAPNASMMTGPGTNTYLIGEGSIAVIDPGTTDPGHLARILTAGTVELVIITHGHPDHYSGAFHIADATGARVAASEKFWSRFPAPPTAVTLREGEVIIAAGLELEVLETPGHSSDHVSLYERERGILFCGDVVLGQGTAVISPPDGDLIAYLASLNKLRALEPKVLLPGHFEPSTDPVGLIDWYIAHRREREEQILSAIDSGADTTEGIVKVVYRDLSTALHPIAERSVMAHLEKLMTEGRVTETGGTYSAS